MTSSERHSTRTVGPAILLGTEDSEKSFIEDKSERKKGMARPVTLLEALESWKAIKISPETHKHPEYFRWPQMVQTGEKKKLRGGYISLGP